MQHKSFRSDVLDISREIQSLAEKEAHSLLFNLTDRELAMNKRYCPGKPYRSL